MLPIFAKNLKAMFLAHLLATIQLLKLQAIMPSRLSCDSEANHSKSRDNFEDSDNSIKFSMTYMNIVSTSKYEEITKYLTLIQQSNLLS